MHKSTRESFRKKQTPSRLPEGIQTLAKSDRVKASHHMEVSKDSKRSEGFFMFQA